MRYKIIIVIDSNFFLIGSKIKTFAMSTTMLNSHASPSKEPDPTSSEPIRDLLSPPREQWRHRQRNSDPDAASDDGSDIMNGSVISTMTDRSGKNLIESLSYHFHWYPSIQLEPWSQSSKEILEKIYSLFFVSCTIL